MRMPYSNHRVSPSICPSVCPITIFCNVISWVNLNAELSYFVYRCLMGRGRHLYTLKAIAQRTRSQWYLCTFFYHDCNVISWVILKPELLLFIHLLVLFSMNRGGHKHFEVDCSKVKVTVKYIPSLFSAMKSLVILRTELSYFIYILLKVDCSKVKVTVIIYVNISWIFRVSLTQNITILHMIICWIKEDRCSKVKVKC